MSESRRDETGEPIGVKELTLEIALFMHGYTTKKNIRPLGCVLLIGGVDKTGCHLFVLDPSGTYREVSAGCSGHKMNESNNILKEAYKADMPFQEALGLAIRATLIEETRKLEEITAAVIETETKTLREITLEEIKEAWKIAFEKKQ